MNHRTLGWLKVLLIGAILILAVAVVAVLVVTRTQWGVERARNYAAGWLKAQVHGTVRIGQITSGGLLGGAVIHDLSIADEKGRHFLSVDSARAAYNWRSFLSGQIVLGSLDLYNPKLTLEELPGNRKWNYEYIFADTANPNAPSLRRLIEVQRVRVYNGNAIVRMPFAVKGRALVPGDTARLILEQVPGGTARVFRFANINAQLPRVLWESPQETGKLFQIANVSGKGWIYVDAFDLRDARGKVGMRDTVVSFDVPMFRAPNSTGSMFGRVVQRNGQNVYDIKVNADPFSFTDARWIYPRLPDGGGALGLRIQTLPRGILWLVTEARLRAPGTNIAGTFGVVTGDTTYFTRVSLRASPLNLRVIEDMLPGTLPVKGLLVGTVVVEGPLSSLSTKDDLKLAGNAPNSGAAVRWQGTVDLRKPYGAKSLTAELSHFDLSLVDALKPLHIGGAVSGRVEATTDNLLYYGDNVEVMRNSHAVNGNPGSSLKFTAKLQHKRDGTGTSDFEGSGDVGMRAGARTFEVRAKAAPLPCRWTHQRLPPRCKARPPLKGRWAGGRQRTSRNDPGVAVAVAAHPPICPSAHQRRNKTQIARKLPG